MRRGLRFLVCRSYVGRAWPGLVVLGGLLAGALPARGQQTGSVMGRVTNASTNQPVGGAQVHVVGTQLGGISASNGRYLILNVPAGTHELRVELIGYRTETRTVTVAAGQATAVDVALSETAIELDEVVVTGTAGAATRRDLGNSVGTIGSRELQLTPIMDVAEVLYGRTTGLTQMRNDGQVGAGSRIMLRGLNSVTQDVQPLIYVDGVRVGNNAGVYGNMLTRNRGPAGAQTSPNPLDNINPDDIERIEVIRGAAASTIYGTEAAGGVIQVFTKRGRTGQAPSWSARLTGGARKLTGNNLGPVIGKMDDWMFLKPWGKTGYLTEADVSVTGGTELLRYFFSANYDWGEGYFAHPDQRPKNVAERWSMRGNFGFEPAPGLRFDVNSSYTRREAAYLESGDNLTGFMLNVLRGSQDYTQRFTDSILFDIDNRSEINHFVGGVTVTHTPTTSLVNQLTVGLDLQDIFNEQTMPFDFPLRPQGLRDVNDYEHRLLTVDYNGTWSRPVTPALSSRFTWGGQIFADWTRTIFGFSEQFGGPGPKTLSSGASKRSDEQLLKVVTAGFFFQEVLGWKDRAFVTLGVRVDGNSAFGEDLGLQTYPKLSASYVLSDHAFWPQWWGVMKLRGAFGESGKAPGAFDAVRTWNPVSGYEGQPGVTPANLGNSELGPERTQELELGFEASMLEDRLGVDFTVYRARTNDALFGVSDPPSKGFLNPQLRNVGVIENRGFELSLTGTPVSTDVLRWDVTARFSYNKSEVVSLGGAPEFYLGWGTTLGQWMREGYPVASYFGAKVKNPNEKAAPIIEENQYYGPIYPPKVYSFSSTVNVARRLTLHAVGEYNGGHYQFNIMTWQQVRRGLWPECKEREPMEQAEAIWRARCAKPTPRFDFWTTPADFFKVRNVSLTYQLPPGWIPWASNSSFTVLVQNLWKWQKPVGIDPELTVESAFAPFPARYEYYNIPIPTTVTASLRVNF